MDSYKITAGSFQGPLDLLMHLIEKGQFDIYDLPIASVTEQYLSYINGMWEFNIEIASEFLVTAATLLEIKSRMLLPQQPAAQKTQDPNEEDPRQELVRRLIVYRQFKELGEIFTSLWEKNNLYAVRAPMIFTNTPLPPQNLTIDRLLAAVAGLMAADNEEITYINNEEINVQDKIADILRLLKIKGHSLTLRATLIRSGSSMELVASFLAVLELLRLKTIKISQPERFGNIYLYLREDMRVL